VTGPAYALQVVYVKEQGVFSFVRLYVVDHCRLCVSCSAL
jgi:hypothetical protein